MEFHTACCIHTTLTSAMKCLSQVGITICCFSLWLHPWHRQISSPLKSSFISRAKFFWLFAKLFAHSSIKSNIKNYNFVARLVRNCLLVVTCGTWGWKVLYWEFVVGGLLIYSADWFIDFGTKMRFTFGQKYLLLILLLKNSLCLPLIAFSNLKSLQIFFFSFSLQV